MQEQYNHKDHFRAEGDVIKSPSASEISLRDSLIKLLRDSGIEVIDDVKEGQRVLAVGSSAEGAKKLNDLDTNVVRYQMAYHGSANDFDAFDTISHLSEGEGNQAFGAGTYVADQKDLGVQYANIAYDNNHIKQTEHWNAKRLISRFPTFEDFLNNPKTKEAMAKNGKTIADLKAYYENSTKLAEPPHVLYTLDIPDDNGKNYLDWDGWLSRKQADTIRERLYKAILALNDDYKGSEKYLAQDLSVIKEGSHIGDTYGTISDYLGSDKSASEFLHDLGYTGIKVHAAHNSNDVRYKDNWNYVIFNDKDLKIKDKIRFFRTSNGDAYGFTSGGKIYIDPRIATAETPIHEYAHLWGEALRKGNPEEWKNVVGLMKQETVIWDDVKKNYPHLESEDDIADEVLATYSGRQGAKKLRALRDSIVDSEDTVDNKRAALSSLERFKQLLSRLWKDIADLLHIHFTTAEEVADKVMIDLLNGIKPAIKEKTATQYQFIGEVGAASLDKSQEQTIRLDNLRIARQMEASNRDALAIKMATGWERGADGKWRYEIGDGTMKSGWEAKARVGSVALSDVINNEELFTSFPQMRNISVALSVMDDGTLGWYNSLLDRIELNDNPSVDLQGVLLHEIQHAIQHAEGFEPGTNTERTSAVVEKMKDTYWKEVDDIEDRLAEVELENNIDVDMEKWLDRHAKFSNPDVQRLHDEYLTLTDKYFQIVTAEEMYHRNAGEVESRNVTARRGMSSSDRRKSLAWETEDVARKDQIFLRDENVVSANSDHFSAEINDINKSFNEELEKYEKGQVPFGTRFELGMPSKELESAGFPYLPITMRASLLSQKAGMDRHPFVASDLRDLVKAMQKPIAIFTYSKENMRNLIVDVMHDDKHFLVGVTLDYQAGGIEVNSVSGLFPKESHEWIKWIQDGKAIRIDQKKKVLDLIDSLRTNPAESERIGLNLSRTANLVKEFENPVKKDENLSANSKIRFQFIGELGAEYLDSSEERTVRIDNLAVAKQMEAKNKLPLTIKRATGWERGADGEWRYETMDPDYVSWAPRDLPERQDEIINNLSEKNQDELFRYEDIPFEERTDKDKEEYKKLKDRLGLTRFDDMGYDGKSEAKLSDVLKGKYADDLFKAYPQLKDVTVKYAPLGMYKYGSWDVRNNTIFLNTRLSDDSARKSILHEIQHAIQDIEGFARGSNPEMFHSATVKDTMIADFDKELVKTFGNDDFRTIRRALESHDEEYSDFRYRYSELDSANPYLIDELKKDLMESYNERDFMLAYNKHLQSGIRGSKMEQYHKTAGEVEARNVEVRANTSEEFRRNHLGELTEDVARKDQIFLRDDIAISANNSTEDVPRHLQIMNNQHMDNSQSIAMAPLQPRLTPLYHAMEYSLTHDGVWMLPTHRQNSVPSSPFVDLMMVLKSNHDTSTLTPKQTGEKPQLEQSLPNSKKIYFDALALARQVGEAEGFRVERYFKPMDSQYDPKSDKVRYMMIPTKDLSNMPSTLGAVRANDLYRAVVSAIGGHERLERQDRLPLLTDDASKHELLVRDIAAGVLMSRQGLPAVFSNEVQDNIAYYEREIKENPSFEASLMKDVDSTMKALDLSIKGERVDYAALRRPLQEPVDQRNYSIVQDLAKFPNSESREVIVIKDKAAGKADVILPQGASKRVWNEAPGLHKDDLTKALEKNGITKVSYYNSGGSLRLMQPNDYFNGKDVLLANYSKQSLNTKKTLDLSAAIRKTHDKVIEKFRCIKDDNGKYVFFIKPEGEKSFSVYPSKEQRDRFFKAAKEDKSDREKIRYDICQETYRYAKEHPEAKQEVIMPPLAEDIDLSKISDVSLKREESSHCVFIEAKINGEVKRQPVTPQQWERLWLADDMQAYKNNLAANIFAPDIKVKYEDVMESVKDPEISNGSEGQSTEESEEEEEEEVRRPALHL